MAVRTNGTSVKKIISVGTAVDVDDFIAGANLFVDAYLADSGYSTALLTEIERYVTAHLIAISLERQAESEEIDDASVKYSGKMGKGLELTTYGQHALMLDVKSLLPTTTDSSRKASLEML